jgi:hypothetical protein
LVDALIRSANAAGGHATVLKHGDDRAGGLLLICTEKGGLTAVLERGSDEQSRMVWRPVFSQPLENTDKISTYLENRTKRDTDTWLIELDIADAERFAADFIRSP